MSTIILSLISGIVGIIIAGWISSLIAILILNILGVWSGFNSKSDNPKVALRTMYLFRGTMGLTVGIIFAFMDKWGLNNSILTGIFSLWVLFIHSSSTLPLITLGDLKKAKRHKIGLEILLFASYFATKLTLFSLFKYYEFI